MKFEIVDEIEYLLETAPALPKDVQTCVVGSRSQGSCSLLNKFLLLIIYFLILKYSISSHFFFLSTFIQMIMNMDMHVNCIHMLLNKYIINLPNVLCSFETEIH